MFAGTGSDHEDAHTATLIHPSAAKRRPWAGDTIANMGYPMPPPVPPPYWAPPPPARPQRNTADLAVSVIVLVITVLGSALGCLMSFMMMAFLDYCPPQTCSVNGAVTAALGTIGAVGLIVVAGLVLTVIRLGARKTAWPFAVGTAASAVAAFLLGFLAFNFAVGG